MKRLGPTRKSAWKVTAVIGAGTLLTAAPYLVDPFAVSLLTSVLIFGLLAMSVNLLAGSLGLISLGNAGAFGLAAYTVAIATADFGLGLFPSALLALLLTLIAAAVFGYAAVRTSGVYFFMVTLAGGVVMSGLALRWTSVTGGENGVGGIPRPQGFEEYWLFYYFVLVTVAIVVVLLYRVSRSPFGLTLVGIRESPTRMSTLGYNIGIHKLLGFTLAGFVAGIAGVLYATYDQFVSPSVLSVSQSAEALFMVILGGTGTFAGPMVGATAIVFGENWLSGYTDRWLLIMGALYVVVIIVAPDGITGGTKRALRSLRERRSLQALQLQVEVPASARGEVTNAAEVEAASEQRGARSMDGEGSGERRRSNASRFGL